MKLLSCLQYGFDTKVCKKNLKKAVARLENEIQKESKKEKIECMLLKGKEVGNTILAENEQNGHIESLARRRNRKEVLEYVITICKYLKENMILIQFKESQITIITSIETFIYCSKLLPEIQELKATRKQFKRHYGRFFVNRAMNNSNRSVNKWVESKLLSYISLEQIQNIKLEFDKDPQPIAPSMNTRSMAQENHTEMYMAVQEPYSLPRQTVVVHDDNTIFTKEWEELPTAFGRVSSSPCAYEETDNSDCQSCTSSPISRLAPILPIFIFRPNPKLEIGFDVRTRNPLYVLEEINGIYHERTSKHRPRFFEENDLPEIYRSKFSHYFRSGYDRGHMAPVADFGDENEASDTFNLCNVSPQLHSMNCSVWAKLESWCRRVSRVEYPLGRKTYVTTGPLWLPSNETTDNNFSYTFPAIGSDPSSLVQVPTHFFKVVVVVQYDSIQKLACFVVPNEEVQTGTSTLLHRYIVQWTDLEAMSGLQFFPKLTSVQGWKERASKLAISTRRKCSLSSNCFLVLSPRSNNNKDSSPIETTMSLEHLFVH